MMKKYSDILFDICLMIRSSGLRFLPYVVFEFFDYESGKSYLRVFKSGWLATTLSDAIIMEDVRKVFGYIKNNKVELDLLVDSIIHSAQETYEREGYDIYFDRSRFESSVFFDPEKKNLDKKKLRHCLNKLINLDITVSDEAELEFIISFIANGIDMEERLEAFYNEYPLDYKIDSLFPISDSARVYEPTAIEYSQPHRLGSDTHKFLFFGISRMVGYRSARYRRSGRVFRDGVPIGEVHIATNVELDPDLVNKPVIYDVDYWSDGFLMIDLSEDTINEAKQMYGCNGYTFAYLEEASHILSTGIEMFTEMKITGCLFEVIYDHVSRNIGIITRFDEESLMLAFIEALRQKIPNSWRSSTVAVRDGIKRKDYLGSDYRLVYDLPIKDLYFDADKSDFLRLLKSRYRFNVYVKTQRPFHYDLVFGMENLEHVLRIEFSKTYKHTPDPRKLYDFVKSAISNLVGLLTTVFYNYADVWSSIARKWWHGVEIPLQSADSKLQRVVKKLKRGLELTDEELNGIERVSNKLSNQSKEIGLIKNVMTALSECISSPEGTQMTFRERRTFGLQQLFSESMKKNDAMQVIEVLQSDSDDEYEGYLKPLCYAVDRITEDGPQCVWKKENGIGKIKTWIEMGDTHLVFYWSHIHRNPNMELGLIKDAIKGINKHGGLFLANLVLKLICKSEYGIDVKRERDAEGRSRFTFWFDLPIN